MSKHQNVARAEENEAMADSERRFLESVERGEAAADPRAAAPMTQAGLSCEARGLVESRRLHPGAPMTLHMTAAGRSLLTRARDVDLARETQAQEDMRDAMQAIEPDEGWH